jgi:hypothetical protein
MRTSQKTARIITTIGIDLGKSTFHLIAVHFQKAPNPPEIPIAARVIRYQFRITTFIHWTEEVL